MNRTGMAFPADMAMDPDKTYTERAECPRIFVFELCAFKNSTDVCVWFLSSDIAWRVVGMLCTAQV
jgi:hypothetical protein